MDFAILPEGQGSEPTIWVDGVSSQAEGLHLSHWPGNRTPSELKRDLSTEIALAFAELPEAKRDELSGGARLVANNHYDTDGVLALFAVLRPEEALPRRKAMAEASLAGDLFRVPTENAYALDCIVTNFAQAERSPLDLNGLSDRARYERATAELLERMPSLLDGELTEFEPLYLPELERYRADREVLAAASRDELVHLDLVVWTLKEPADPGRHALFAACDMDRQLVLAPGPEGTTARFIQGTKNWFDWVSEPVQPRPDFDALHASLEAKVAGWQLASPSSASPEVYFGQPGLPSYSEHAGEFLRPCSESHLVLKEIFVEAVRDTWVFDDEDDEGDEPFDFPA